MFSIDGGRNDIIQVKFRKHNPGARVYFAVGMNLQNSKGETIKELSGTEIRVSFPNSIYLVVYHSDGGFDDVGMFEFDYRYLDQDTNEAKFDPIDGYEIQITEIKGK